MTAQTASDVFTRQAWLDYASELERGHGHVPGLMLRLRSDVQHPRYPGQDVAAQALLDQLHEFLPECQVALAFSGTVDYD